MEGKFKTCSKSGSWNCTTLLLQCSITNEPWLSKNLQRKVTSSWALLCSVPQHVPLTLLAAETGLYTTSEESLSRRLVTLPVIQHIHLSLSPELLLMLLHVFFSLGHNLFSFPPRMGSCSRTLPLLGFDLLLGLLHIVWTLHSFSLHRTVHYPWFNLIIQKGESMHVLLVHSYNISCLSLSFKKNPSESQNTCAQGSILGPLIKLHARYLQFSIGCNTNHNIRFQTFKSRHYCFIGQQLMIISITD